MRSRDGPIEPLGGAEIATEDRGVGIDATIAEEGPVSARLLDEPRIAAGDEHRGIGARLGKDSAERIADEGVAEELQSVRALFRLESNAIGRSDEHAVGDGVRALDRAPRFHLGLAELRFLGRVPTDRRGVEKHLGAEQTRYACRLWIPLVPADQHADVRITSMPDAESARLLRRFADAVDMVVLRRIARCEV